MHRTSFTRQAANLWAVKQRLHRHLLTQVCCDPQRWIVDSAAVPICRFARAYRCRRLRELAGWGHDEVAKQTYLGVRTHLRVCWPGVIVEGRLAPAGVSDLAVGQELLAGVTGWVLADRNYGRPRLADQLQLQSGWLLAPPMGTPRQRQRPLAWLVAKRRRVETVIAQLTGRYQLRRVWARDGWHLWSRWLRKLLSHTMAVLLCQRSGLPPLQFAQLVTT